MTLWGMNFFSLGETFKNLREKEPYKCTRQRSKTSSIVIFLGNLDKFGNLAGVKHLTNSTPDLYLIKSNLQTMVVVGESSNRG